MARFFRAALREILERADNSIQIIGYLDKKKRTCSNIFNTKKKKYSTVFKFLSLFHIYD